jgi:hypothetical protein
MQVNWSDCERVWWDTGTCGAEQSACTSGIPSISGYLRGTLSAAPDGWQLTAEDYGSTTGGTMIEPGVCGPAAQLHDFRAEVGAGVIAALEAVRFDCAP